jgi:hypothetical protein
MNLNTYSDFSTEDDDAYVSINMYKFGVTIPTSNVRANFEFVSGNLLEAVRQSRSEKLEIFDSQMQPVNGVGGGGLPEFPGAAFAKLTTWDDNWYLFELINAEPYSGWDPVDNHPTNGRIIEAKTQEGIGYSVSYKSWTQTEIDQSPSRLWQIDSVVDTAGNTLSFTSTPSSTAEPGS